MKMYMTINSVLVISSIPGKRKSKNDLTSIRRTYVQSLSFNSCSPCI